MSIHLTNNIKSFYEKDRRLIDDSNKSEKNIIDALSDIKMYLEEKAKIIDAHIEHANKVTLNECQKIYYKNGGPIPDDKNNRVYMKPDGGIFYIILKNGEKIPILIIEDKVQGTNDIRFENGQEKQATGNAIERAAKNIRGSEMLFSGENIFPYIIFASGCDFHSCETIASRLVMMNMGYPNHLIELTPDITQEEINSKINFILENININKQRGYSIASCFVKTHKWNMMKHGSSRWHKEEIVIICKKIIDKIFNYLDEKLYTSVQ